MKLTKIVSIILKYHQVLLICCFIVITNTLLFVYFNKPEKVEKPNLTNHFHSNKVVQHIHQSWKTYDVPPRFKRWSQSWSRCFPNWRYTIWTNEDNRNLLKKYYNWLLDFYDNLPKEIHRADTMRYVYLYHFGGIYADLDVECLRPFEHLLANYSIVFGAMAGQSGPPLKEGIVENHFMYSRANHPFWLEVINDIMRGGGSRRKKDPVSWTGPDMLGENIMKFRNSYENEWKIYEPKYFNPFSWSKNLAPKECGLLNRMTEENVIFCGEYFNQSGSYVVHYHTASWGTGKAL